MRVLFIAHDLLHEARRRRWFLLLAIALSLALAFLALALRMEVVDGALAATSLFGRALDTDIRSADVALRPLFRVVSYSIFYGGLAFGILACADFGPALLSPGRIEHLLSLPVRRWELLAGSFLGVLSLSLLGALYGAGGVSVILGVKTGVWTLRPVAAALVSSIAFSAVYAVMLATAVFVRSSALSAAVGGMLAIGGIVAGYRSDLEGLFRAGPGRIFFSVATYCLPRISSVGDACAEFAASKPIDAASFVRMLVGLIAFGVASLSFGIWWFERKDY